MNSQIKLLSASKKFKILFGTIGALVVVILLADKFYIANLFVIVIIFVITFYAIMGIISQFGNKKYSVYENMCLLLILPIYIAIAGIEYLFAILELFQKRICKNNKRN